MESESLAVLFSAVVPVLAALLGSRGSQRTVTAVRERVQDRLAYIKEHPQEGKVVIPRRLPKPNSSGVTPPTPGQVEVGARVKAYEKALTAESGKVAKRFHATEPSKKHVKLAAKHLGLSRSSKLVAIADVCLALGAILVGVGISYKVNIWTGGTPGPDTADVALVCALLGTAVCVAAATAKIMNQD